MSEELRRRDESREHRPPPIPGEVEAGLRRGSRRRAPESSLLDAEVFLQDRDSFVYRPSTAPALQH
jgi:hypothetical protein